MLVHTTPFEEGLAKCLQLAAKAAEKVKWEGFVGLLSKEEIERSL